MNSNWSVWIWFLPAIVTKIIFVTLVSTLINSNMSMKIQRISLLPSISWWSIEMWAKPEDSPTSQGQGSWWLCLKNMHCILNPEMKMKIRWCCRLTLFIRIAADHVVRSLNSSSCFNPMMAVWLDGITKLIYSSKRLVYCNGCIHCTVWEGLMSCMI